jgi:hypothetical protein
MQRRRAVLNRAITLFLIDQNSIVGKLNSRIRWAISTAFMQSSPYLLEFGRSEVALQL